MCFFQAEDGIRYLVRSRGLGDVYKRQAQERREKLKKLKEKIFAESENLYQALWQDYKKPREEADLAEVLPVICLLYTSDAADERSSVDLGGRRIIKKKKKENITRHAGATMKSD